jgi:hypothetical protein
MLRLLLLAGALSALAMAQSLPERAAQVLAANCTSCHGGNLRVSELDLRTRDAMAKGGTRGPALVVGKAEQSRLYRFAAGLDQPQMPPGKKLSAEDLATLKAWIDSGAELAGAPVASGSLAAAEDRPITENERKYWAFQKPVRPAAPAENAIDHFLALKWKAKGLTPAPRAAKAVLVRRAYLDLLGLPPTPDQVAAFVNDARPDAWPRLVDSLLASPHYGERWARHWLDVVRYADSGGFEYDRDRINAYRYRDYVVKALNSDKPFDRFLKEQLAGDELYPDSQEAWIATGFLRLGPENNVKNEQTRLDELDDLVVTTANGLLGMTVGCARCHNHKFDAIAQKDYYRMQAVFFPLKPFERPLVDPAAEAKFKADTKAVEALQQPLKDQLKALEKPFRDKIIARRKATLPDYLRTALATPEAQRTEGQKLNVIQFEKSVENIYEDDLVRELTPAVLPERKRLVARIAEIEKTKPEMPAAMTITEPGREAPPSHFLHRGGAGSKGSVMTPGVLSATVPEDWPFPAAPADAKTSHRRAAFAQWIASPDNPLVSRVWVNRMWQFHFGEGIVRTPSNFGKMGERPTHPELLDWLATEFVANNWSVKHLHRLMMNSAAYQMAADDTEANRKLDPDNRWLWRMPRRRLEGEAIRDSILALAGTLDNTIGGPAVLPYIDPALYQASSKRTWHGKAVDDPSTNRRSLYVFSKRSIPLPMLDVFDKPDTITSCARRNRSTIAPQALILMNNEFVHLQAKAFAERLTREAPTAQARVERGYQLAFGRPPSAREAKRAVEFIQASPAGLNDFCHALVNVNEFVYVP